jgi:hypothetical protein
MQDVRRRFGHGACRLLVRWWEFQRRGVLHLHLDLPYATLREKQAADLYALRLRQLARSYGFGNAGWIKTMTREKAAGNYAAGYVKGGGSKLPLREAVKLPGMPRQPVHVANELKAVGLCSMRELRLRRFLYAAFGLAWRDSTAVLHWLRVERVRFPTDRYRRQKIVSSDAEPEQVKLFGEAPLGIDRNAYRRVDRKMSWREVMFYLRVGPYARPVTTAH